MPEEGGCPPKCASIAAFSTRSELGIGVAFNGATGIDFGPSRRESEWAKQVQERSRGATP
jgi:hypothetical protein